MAEKFNYDSIFSATSRDAPPGAFRHAKYDFAVAYSDPESLPLDELVDSLKSGFEREGRDLAYYSDGIGLPGTTAPGGQETGPRTQHESGRPTTWC